MTKCLVNAVTGKVKSWYGACPVCRLTRTLPEFEWRMVGYYSAVACSECPELHAEALHLAARLRLAYRTTAESESRWQTITQRSKNWRVHTILQRVIQKLIIPADQRRPKSLQMTGFEFGPSVARCILAAVESAGRCILTSPRAEPHGSGIGASTWSEQWDRQP